MSKDLQHHTSKHGEKEEDPWEVNNAGNRLCKCFMRKDMHSAYLLDHKKRTVVSNTIYKHCLQENSRVVHINTSKQWSVTQWILQLEIWMILWSRRELMLVWRSKTSKPVLNCSVWIKTQHKHSHTCSVQRTVKSHQSWHGTKKLQEKHFSLCLN